MQISEVLSIHNSYKAENSHSDILGDPFLMQTNPVYKNIKNHAVKIGCRYVEAWPEYLLMPFHALGEIVENKKIPYVPSGRLLQKLEDKRADVLFLEDVNVPPSYHLHEAAHVIAEDLFAGSQFTNPQEKILKTIVCESFANTIDALACVYATDEMHSFFLKHNCYMHPNKKSSAVMARMQENMGPRFTFICALISYVHANFLREGISAEVLKELATRYAPEAKFADKQLKNCQAMMKIAERLDPLFRIQTTNMYLKVEGFDGEIYDLLDFPFMKLFEKNPAFFKAVEAMSSLLL